MITLTNAGLTTTIEPENGGLIASLVWRHGGRDHALLHAPASRPSGDGRAWYGCWPLVPFANRAFGGVMMDGDEAIALPPNDARGDTLHGFGWNAPWAVADESAHALTIGHHRREGADPYRYGAEQAISLEDDGCLLVGLRIRNEASRPLPFGIGLHPWFPLDPDTTVTVDASEVLAVGDGYRAVGHGPVGEATDFRSPRRLDGPGECVANFLDWRGEAIIAYPSRGYSIGVSASESLRRPLLWTPGGADFVCFEPMSHALGAPSEAAARAAAPLARLEPGERLTGFMRVRPIAHDA
jgi:aldose 1-epimerase